MMPETTDKDREEAMEELAVGIVALCIHEGPIMEQMGEIKEMIRDYDARIRAEAKAEALAAMAPCIEAYESALKDKAGECTWTEDPEGYWSTSCGRSWTFIEGGPEENGVRYCHGCGKPVRIADEPNKEE